MFEFMDSHTDEAVIKVIGVGGGGGNAVEHMVRQNIEGVEFITVNTDAQALRNSSANTTLQIGGGITKGLEPEPIRKWAVMPPWKTGKRCVSC